MIIIIYIRLNVGVVPFTYRFRYKLDFNLSVLHLIKSNVRGVRKLYLCNLGTGIRFFSLLPS